MPAGDRVQSRRPMEPSIRGTRRTNLENDHGIGRRISNLIERRQTRLRHPWHSIEMRWVQLWSMSDSRPESSRRRKQTHIKHLSGKSGQKRLRGTAVALFMCRRKPMAIAKPAVIETPRLRQTLATIDAMFYLALSIMAIGVCVGFAIH